MGPRNWAGADAAIARWRARRRGVRTVEVAAALATTAGPGADVWFVGRTDAASLAADAAAGAVRIAAAGRRHALALAASLARRTIVRQTFLLHAALPRQARRVAGAAMAGVALQIDADALALRVFAACQAVLALLLAPGFALGVSRAERRGGHPGDRGQQRPPRGEAKDEGIEARRVHTPGPCPSPPALPQPASLTGRTCRGKRRRPGSGNTPDQESSSHPSSRDSRPSPEGSIGRFDSKACLSRSKWDSPAGSGRSPDGPGCRPRRSGRDRTFGPLDNRRRRRPAPSHNMSRSTCRSRCSCNTRCGHRAGFRPGNSRRRRGRLPKARSRSSRGTA